MAKNCSATVRSGGFSKLAATAGLFCTLAAQAQSTVPATEDYGVPGAFSVFVWGLVLMAAVLIGSLAWLILWDTRKARRAAAGPQQQRWNLAAGEQRLARLRGGSSISILH
jgi:cytochrome c-type biogenesis protein CcmH/NrfG